MCSGWGGEWFKNNHIKLNADKCQLFISGNKYEHCWVNTGVSKLWESINVKLLGVNIDNHLKFDKHLSGICSKASQKLNILTRLAKFLTFETKRLIFKSIALWSGCFTVGLLIKKLTDFIREH